jgi:hypothetical protein
MAALSTLERLSLNSGAEFAACSGGVAGVLEAAAVIRGWGALTDGRACVNDAAPFIAPISNCEDWHVLKWQSAHPSDFTGARICAQQRISATGLEMDS